MKSKFFLMAFAMGLIVVTDQKVFAEADNAGSDVCGLGWSITQKKTLIATWTRSTTNATSSPTWSMTSGTSGCQSHALVKADQETVNFISQNFKSIKVDMAEGSGEYLSGLAMMMDCNESAFESVTHENYKQIMLNSDAYDAFQKIKVAAANACAIHS